MADNICTIIRPPAGAYHGAFPGDYLIPEALDAFENKAGATIMIDGMYLRLVVNRGMSEDFQVVSKPGSKFIVIVVKDLEKAKGMIGRLIAHPAFSVIKDRTSLKLAVEKLIEIRQWVHLDYALKFLPFSSGLNFPAGDADLLAQRNSVMMLRLEPWTPKAINGLDNLTEEDYTLDSIAAGKWDAMLIRFAQGAIAFSQKHGGKVPIWVSFAHEMNVEKINRYRYPWAGDPKKFVAAYRHVVDIVRAEFEKAKATQIINWVWNVNIDFPRMQDYYPETEDDRKQGKIYVHWVAADGYTTEDYIRATWRPFPLLFSTSLAQLSYFGKPIAVIEYGCDANEYPGNPKQTEFDRKRKAIFIAGAQLYIVKDGRIKAASYFDLSKWEGGNTKDWEINTADQVLAYHGATQAHGYYYQEPLQIETIPCQEAAQSLSQAEEMNPERLMKDRGLILEQLLKYIILFSEENIESWGRVGGKDQVTPWLYQKEEMVILVEGLLNAWFIYREVGKPADPAKGCESSGKNCFEVSEQNRKELRKALGLDYLPHAPKVPYLIDAINFAIGVLRIRYTGEGEETRSEDNVKWNEKIMKKRAIFDLANLVLILAGELSERENREVLAALLETYLETIIKNNAIHDRVLRASLVNLLLGIEGPHRLAAADRDWLIKLSERESQGIYFNEADNRKLWALVKKHFQDPTVAPLVALLRGSELIDKPTQFEIMAVLEKIFIDPVREVEKSLHDGTMFDVIGELEKQGLNAGERQYLRGLREKIAERRKKAEEGEEIDTLLPEEETRIYRMMDRYLPNSTLEIILPNLTAIERSFYKKRQQLLYGKNLALRAFIAKDFLKGRMTPAEIEKLFANALAILQEGLKDEYIDQADISEIHLWIAKILMVKAGLEKDRDKEFAMLEEAIGHIKETKVDLRHLQLHTQEIERMHAEALARQGFILKEQKKDYEDKFKQAKEILERVIKWEAEYRALVGEGEPLWAKQTVALAKLWHAKVRLVEVGEEKKATRSETVAYQKAELLKIEEMLKGALEGLQSEPALQADVYRALGEQQIRLAYALKDLGASETEALALVERSRQYLGIAIKNGVDLTKIEGYFWTTKGLLMAADYAKTRDEELAKVAEANQYLAEALKIAPTIKEIKGRSLSDLYAAQGEILLKQNQFKAAIPWFERALATYDKNYEARINLADIKSWQKEYDEAERLYRQVLADKGAASVRYSDELAFDRAQIGLLELRLRKDRSDQELEQFALELIQKEAPASFLRKRAVLALIELYSGKQQKYPDALALYQSLSPQVLADPRFKAEVARRYAEILGGLREFDHARKVLDGIPKEWWREETYLAYAELEMREKEKITPSVIAAAQQVFEKRADDPMLVLRAILDLMEGYASGKDFEEMIALGDALLARNYRSEEQAEIRKLFPTLDDKLLEKVFTNFSAKNAAGAKILVWSKLIDGLIWERNHYAQALKELDQIQDALSRAGLPLLETRLYRADLYLKRAEIYRYGKGYRLTGYKTAKEYYTKALEIIEKNLPAGWDDITVLRGRSYLGLAKLEQQEGNPVAAHDYLVKALEAIAQLSVPPKSLAGEIHRMRQNVFEPQVALGYRTISDPRASESRYRLTLQVPFWRDQIVPYFSNDIDQRQDGRGSSQLSTAYLGVRLKPEFLGKRFTLDAKGKIDSRQLERSSGAGLPTYFRRPDLTLAATHWGKWWVTMASHERNFNDSRLDTYYGFTGLNLGGTKNPYLNLRVGPTGSYYHFGYFGDWRQRFFAGARLEYELELAEIIPSLDYDVVKIRLGGTVPIYEYEREPRHDYLTADREEDRFPGRGAPWQGEGGLEINLGEAGKFNLSAGFTRQRTATYSYHPWNVNLDYQVNLYRLYQLLSGE